MKNLRKKKCTFLRPTSIASVKCPKKADDYSIAKKRQSEAARVSGAGRGVRVSGAGRGVAVAVAAAVAVAVVVGAAVVVAVVVVGCCCCLHI